jgi:L-amino acid N-acyltransferase YncA/putative methionine-R-sulfoxide reductase with GAF domain
MRSDGHNILCCPMMALVRNTTNLDIPGIARVYAHHVLHGAATFEIDPPECDEMDRRRLEIQSRGLPYLVAEAEGLIAGYAYAGLYRPRPAYRFTVEDSIYIHPDFLARGLGQLLLSKVIEICQEKGYRQMVAVIGDSGNKASIRLHAKFGFREAGVLERVGRKFGRWFDTVLMQRELSADGRVQELNAMLERVENRGAALHQLANFLRRTGNYRWVGLYQIDNNAGEIRNVAFSGSGAPAHPIFPIDKGLTGAAIRERKTVNIGDVTADRRYLMTFGTTRSEIVVPIFDSRGSVIGTIDVESEVVEAFSDKDQIFLEDCAEIARRLWTTA